MLSAQFILILNKKSSKNLLLNLIFMELKEKIDAIYEKIARKDLTLWCKFECDISEFVEEKYQKQLKWHITKCVYVFQKFYGSGLWFIYCDNIPVKNLNWKIVNSYWIIETYNTILEEDIKVIGHPIMIGDIMEYFYGSVRFSEWWKCWRKLTKPIEDQSDGCINFIYNLISK